MENNEFENPQERLLDEVQRVLEIFNKMVKLTVINHKEVLTVEEFAAYTGIATNYVYQLTHEKRIPYYKPEGKKIYFKRSEVENWLLRNRHKTNSEIESDAVTYLTLNKKGKGYLSSMN